MQSNNSNTFEEIIKYRGKVIKEFDDIINEEIKLENLYYSQRYQEMMSHIQKIINNHPAETAVWNNIDQTQSTTYKEHFKSASAFLYANAVKILIEHGIDILNSNPNNR